MGPIVALAYVAVGIALRPILRRGELPITLFIGACLAWIGLSFLIGLLTGQIPVASVVIGTLINVYLLRNGRRLAREIGSGKGLV